MKYHIIEPDCDINVYNYCAYCGQHLYKIENEQKKVCPEGCVEVTFTSEYTKVF